MTKLDQANCIIVARLTKQRAVLPEDLCHLLNDEEKLEEAL